jgi:hypothetical protein
MSAMFMSYDITNVKSEHDNSNDTYVSTSCFNPHCLRMHQVTEEDRTRWAQVIYIIHNDCELPPL